MAVLDESTLYRLTIHGAVAPAVQDILRIDPRLIPDLEALALHAQFEHDTLDHFNGRALIPHRGRRAAVQAAGVTSVGGCRGGHQVGERPQTTAAMRVRLILGSLFQRANRRFDGPTITRTRRRGVQRNYSG